MTALVYPHERTLGTITLVLGLLAWVLLVVGTFGGALIGLLLGFVLYLFAQSALIAHIKGQGVELSASQFPDLHAQFVACCEQLKITALPQAYVLNGNGGLNAFATKFLGTQYVVLMSDVVDAMAQHPDGVRFYIGHELGHLRMKHLTGSLLRWPALWLPLLGAAYSRARESTCDRHGLACSTSPEGAARALAALSAGAQRWQQLDLAAYVGQAKHSAGFWMSFHELNAAYPWLTKRAARVLGQESQLPARHPLAVLPAMFVPFAGRLGGGFAVVILVYIVGVLAAVALPAYNDYTSRAKLADAQAQTDAARQAIARYYEANAAIPASLGAVGLSEQAGPDLRLTLSQTDMSLTVSTSKGALVFTPSRSDTDRITWECEGGPGAKPQWLPKTCAPGSTDK